MARIFKKKVPILVETFCVNLCNSYFFSSAGLAGVVVSVFAAGVSAGFEVEMDDSSITFELESFNVPVKLRLDKRINRIKSRRHVKSNICKHHRRMRIVDPRK